MDMVRQVKGSMQTFLIIQSIILKNWSDLSL